MSIITAAHFSLFTLKEFMYVVKREEGSVCVISIDKIPIFTSLFSTKGP